VNPKYRRPPKGLVKKIEYYIKTKVINSSPSNSEIELENYIDRIFSDLENIKTGKVPAKYKYKTEKTPAKSKYRRLLKYIIIKIESDMKTEVINSSPSDLEVELENYMN
jgi:hypothetical protein